VSALAGRATAGDADAFGDLVARHERAALAIAYGICRDAARAADAVQEACLLAWKNRRQLDHPERFSGWFMSIVRRAAVDQVRRNRLRTPSPSDVDLAAPASDEPICRDEVASHVRQALSELDQDTRVAVAMRYFDGQPSRRIAEALDTTPAAIDMRLKRARDRLRDRLRRWITD
jgi:RNA polymerase sigma-70 factor (ECF subfamily)